MYLYHGLSNIFTSNTPYGGFRFEYGGVKYRLTVNHPHMSVVELDEEGEEICESLSDIPDDAMHLTLEEYMQYVIGE